MSDDVYRECAEAWWAKAEEIYPLIPLEKLNMEVAFDCEMTHDACVNRLSGDAPFRAAINKAREPLLAEVEQLKNDLEEAYRWAADNASPQ